MGITSGNEQWSAADVFERVLGSRVLRAGAVVIAHCPRNDDYPGHPSGLAGVSFSCDGRRFWCPRCPEPCAGDALDALCAYGWASNREAARLRLLAEYGAHPLLPDSDDPPGCRAALA